MAMDLLRVACRQIRPGAAMKCVTSLIGRGVSILGLWDNRDATWICVAGHDLGALQRVAGDAGCGPGETAAGFLLQGDTFAQVSEVLRLLGEAGIVPEYLQAVPLEKRRFGIVVQLGAGDIDRAGIALRRLTGSGAKDVDKVDEASEESFPASDPPSFATPGA
jgi:hypothetical protein